MLLKNLTTKTLYDYSNVGYFIISNVKSLSYYFPFYSKFKNICLSTLVFIILMSKMLLDKLFTTSVKLNWCDKFLCEFIYMNRCRKWPYIYKNTTTHIYTSIYLVFNINLITHFYSIVLSISKFQTHLTQGGSFLIMNRVAIFKHLLK